MAWYAQYQTADNQVTAAGYVSDGSIFDDATHDVTPELAGRIPPNLLQPDGTANYQYNSETEQIEPIPE